VAPQVFFVFRYPFEISILNRCLAGANKLMKQRRSRRRTHSRRVWLAKTKTHMPNVLPCGDEGPVSAPEVPVAGGSMHTPRCIASSFRCHRGCGRWTMPEHLADASTPGAGTPRRAARIVFLTCRVHFESERHAAFAWHGRRA